MNQTLAKIIGVVGIIGGTVLLLLGGATQGFVVELVGIVALAFALIIGLFKVGVQK